MDLLMPLLRAMTRTEMTDLVVALAMGRPLPRPIVRAMGEDTPSNRRGLYHRLLEQVVMG